MAILASSLKSISLNANGRGVWIPLDPGLNRILLRCSSWSGSSIAMRYNDEDTTNDFPIESNDTLVTVTANKIIDIFGPGYVCGIVSSYGGTPITMKVLDFQTPISK